MRELKFRVWEEREKAYNTWSYILDTIGNIFRNAYGALIGCDKKDYIVEQYTGLKDNDGKEIYEGDIISFSIPHFDKSTLGYDGETDLVGKIVFDYDRFDIEDKDGVHYDLYSAEEGEVIGNIHENKELLDE